MNTLMEWCEQNERPFKYLADKAGIEYVSLSYYKQKTDAEIFESMPMDKVYKLSLVIPNFVETLTEAYNRR